MIYDHASYTFGKGALVAKDGSGTFVYTFRAVGHNGIDGKLRDIGAIFGTSPTGSLSFLLNLVEIHKGSVHLRHNSLL